VFNHLRTAIYLSAAAVIWFAEDGVFSVAFRFNAAQIAVVTVYFAALFAGAIWLIRRTYLRTGMEEPSEDLPISRIVSMAPVLVVLVGSFAALPIFMIVLVAGAVL